MQPNPAKAVMDPVEYRMPYALYFDDRQTSGPFAEKSQAWADATTHGLVKVIPSLDEDPPRRILDLNYSIRSTADAVSIMRSPHAAASLNSALAKS